MQDREGQRYLDPAALAKIGNLELIAKSVVEGFISGLHKSPYHGFSVEFAQYRQYMPGDDIKHLDWKAYGRTNRYYIKQFEEGNEPQLLPPPRHQRVNDLRLR